MKIENKQENKKEIVEEEDEEVEEKSSPILDKAAKKKMLKFMLIVVGILCFLILILFLASLGSKHTYTYEEVEDIMQQAAESYFKDHPESLPQADGSGVEIDSSNLVAALKMKPLTEYLGDTEICTGTVKVERISSEYLYIPYLTCGNNYATIEFYQKVLEQGTVSSGYGLYANNGTYTYRGENVNNYVQLDKSLWRIVRITSNHNIVLVHAEGLPYTQPWDDRYNEAYLYESGINQYSASRVKEYLEKIYANPSEDDGELILSNRDKAKMVSFRVCVGSRSAESEKKNNEEECKSFVKDQKLGLLTLSDYLYASVDPNCKSANTNSCKNYNYLTIRNDWWLVTASTGDSAKVFSVTRSGNVFSDVAARYAIVRPVIYLNSHVLYKDGNGTADNPYKLR